MYKLQLVTDRESILRAFEQIDNWEDMGFRKPHIRNTVEEAVECLKLHRADGIAIALDEEDDRRMVDYLNERYPMLPILQPSSSPEKNRKYVIELRSILNKIHADISNGDFSEMDMLQICRHDYFRRLLDGKMESADEIIRHMRLLRSKMDPNRPCVLVELAMPPTDDKLEGRWHFGHDLLEVRLRQCFGAELNGMRILPAVLPDNRILVLSCPLAGAEQHSEEESMTSVVLQHTEESIAHTKEFLGLELRVAGIRVLPALTELCKGF